jgi:hypothetical protein
MYIGEDGTYYHCLGGNQSDSVDITRIPIVNGGWQGFRRAIFSIAQPANVRVIHLGAGGTPIGGSEA